MFKPSHYLKCFSLFVILLASGCVKDETTEEDPSGGTTGPTSTSGFTWTVNNGANVTANDYFFVTAFNNIVGKKTSNGSYVDITLDDLNTGNYTISASKGILFEYYDGTKSYSGVSGLVTITAKTGTLLSGNFTSAINSGTITSISGRFTDIPEK